NSSALDYTTSASGPPHKGTGSAEGFVPDGFGLVEVRQEGLRQAPAMMRGRMRFRLVRRPVDLLEPGDVGGKRFRVSPLLEQDELARAVTPSIEGVTQAAGVLRTCTGGCLLDERGTRRLASSLHLHVEEDRQHLPTVVPPTLATRHRRREAFSIAGRRRRSPPICTALAAHNAIRNTGADDLYVHPGWSRDEP